MADTIEIGQEVVEAVAKKVQESIPAPATPADIAKELKALQDAEKEANEAVAKKNIHNEDTQTDSTKFEDLTPEQRFARGFRAYLTKDSGTFKEYSQYVAKAWMEEAKKSGEMLTKADYQNITTLADGEALVPDPEFIAEVERLTDDYGVASRLATVRRTDRNQVTMLSGTNEVSFTKTGEATAQNAQKLTYSQATVALDKYIATLVFTSEIVEDSAINIFQDAANEIARARAKLFDQLVFTDSTDGLLSAGVGDTYKTQTVGSAYTDFDFDDAMNATYKVVSSVRRSGRFFMHPTVWNVLRQKKTGDGSNSAANYYAGGPLQAPTPQIDGYPVELVDVMPHSGDITANEAFAVFGDLSRIRIHVKRVLETKMFDAGVVKDAGGSDVNLITQDMFAMRATLRCKVQTRFEGAFCIIGTGTVS